MVGCGWAGATEWCQRLVLAVASSACHPRRVCCLASSDRSPTHLPLRSQAATLPGSLAERGARKPLGPGGGRPLSPGRASEHVQTGRPLARSAPATRCTPRPRLSSAPVRSATAQRGSPQPRGAARRGLGSAGALAKNARVVRATELWALRGCGLGAPEGWCPSRL